MEGRDEGRRKGKNEERKGRKKGREGGKEDSNISNKSALVRKGHCFSYTCLT